MCKKKAFTTLTILLLIFSLSMPLFMFKSAEATDDPTWLMGLSGYFNGQVGLQAICDTINANNNSLNLFRFSFTPNWKSQVHPYNATAIQYVLDNTNATLVIDRNHLYPAGSASDADAVAHWTSGVVGGVYQVLADFGENPRVMAELINEYTATDFNTRMQALITEIRGDGYITALVANSMWPYTWVAFTDPENNTYGGFHHYANGRSLSMAISRMEDARAAGITKIMNTETGAHDLEYAHYTQSYVDQIEAFYNWSYSLAAPIFNCVWMRENIENWATYVSYDLDLPVMPPPPVTPPTTYPPYLVSYAVNDSKEYHVSNLTANWNATDGLSMGWLIHNKSGTWTTLTQSLTGVTDTSFNQTVLLPAHGIVFAYYLGANDTTGNVTQSDMLYFSVAIDEYTLTITTGGYGTCYANSTSPYHYPGAVVNLTAIGDTGWLFDHWTGDLTGTVNPTTIFVNSSKAVTAIFISTGYIVNLTRGFQVILMNSSSLMFQLDNETNILVTAETAFDTEDSCTLAFSADSGLWTFGNPSASTLHLSWVGNVFHVLVNNDESGNNQNWDFTAASTNTISWQWLLPGETVQPLLPFTFVFGMTGLAALFIGPMYGIHKIRHKEYRNGFIYAVIIFSIGFALFISWLWH